MANKNSWLAGWTRIGEAEFKSAIAEAVKNDPGIIGELRQALLSSALRCGVPLETREKYLGWFDEAAQA